MDPQDFTSVETTPGKPPGYMVGSIHEEDILKASQNYTLPLAVQLALNADVKQANAIGLITALFAGGLLTLAQMVLTNNPACVSSVALRFFVYSAVILNLSGTFLCLMIIKMCTDLPHHAQQMVVLYPKSWPSRVACGETLSRELLTDHWRLLEEFGVSKRYQLMDAAFVFILLAGGIYTFIAVIIWVWLSEPPIVAGLIMITVIPAVSCVVYGVLAAGSGEGWR